MDAINKLEHLKDYLNYIIDIRFSNYKSWQGLRVYNLPTFDYYLKNCVENKGCEYDFTVRRYKTPKQTLNPITKVLHEDRTTKSNKYERWVEYSIWMGTPFNFKQITT